MSYWHSRIRPNGPLRNTSSADRHPEPWSLAPVHAVHLGESLFESHAMEKVVPRIPITCEVDGKAYRGTYWVAGHILTVATGSGGKSRQVGSASHQALAEQLLQQLAQEGKA